MHYLGIDWATDKHDLCLTDEDGRIISQFQITHDMQGFKALHDILKLLSSVKNWTLLAKSYEMHSDGNKG